MCRLLKYPRTPHIQGSQLQPGDEDLKSISVVELADELVIIEEKLDGANSAVSFTPRGELRLQSRGHFLTGGYRERHFDRFKSWTAHHRDELWSRLGSRYVMYGEWLFASHTIFYDQLPAYFVEFDIFDREGDLFLSTLRRQELLAGSAVVSVPVLRSGSISSTAELSALVGRSLFKSCKWRDSLTCSIDREGLNEELVKAQIEACDLMEGLYIKTESDTAVLARYKFVRADFLTAVVDWDSHWLNRPILPNRLAPGMDSYG